MVGTWTARCPVAQVAGKALQGRDPGADFDLAYTVLVATRHICRVDAPNCQFMQDPLYKTVKKIALRVPDFDLVPGFRQIKT